MVDKLAIQTDVNARPPANVPVAKAGQKTAEKPAAGEDTARAAEQQRVTDSQALEAAVSKINDYVQSVHRELNFSVDESVGRTVIKVIDPEDDEVIRQIPPEEILEVAKHLREMAAEEDPRGLLVELKV